MGSTKSGNALVKALVFLFLIGLASGGVLAYLGFQAEGRFDHSLQEGMIATQIDQGQAAFEGFSKAKGEICFSMKVYRAIARVAGKTFQSPEELDQMIVSSALMKAYSDMFELKSASEWIGKAEIISKNVPGPEGAELKRTINSAKDLSNLCYMFENQRYVEVMKGLLAAEKNALPTDQDFFIMEVRLLIACGKALQEPAITGQARELLFFLTSEAGIKGPRINQLWGLLSR